MSNIKRKISVYWMPVLLSIILSDILLLGIFDIVKLIRVRTDYQSINRQNNQTLEAIRDTRNTLSLIQIYIDNIEIMDDKESVRKTEGELLKFEKDFARNYDLVKHTSIGPELKNKVLDSEKDFYGIFLNLIKKNQDYFDLKLNLSNLEKDLSSSSNRLQEALYSRNLGDMAKDVLQLSSLETNHLLSGLESAQDSTIPQIERGLKRMESELQTYRGSGQDEKEAQQLDGYLLEHREIWNKLLNVEKRLSEAKDNLTKDSKNSDKAGQILSSDLSNIEKWLLNHIQENNLNLSRNQKTIRFSSISMGIIFLSGVVAIFSTVKRSGPKKTALESKDRERTEVDVSIYPNGIPKPSVGLQKEDVQGIRKIMERVVEAILKDKSNLINLTKDAYTGNYLYNHSVNVAILAVRIGLGLGLDEQRLVNLGISALLHDIGLVKVPEDVLNKKGKLSEDEYQQLKGHPELGLKILEDIGQIEEEIKYAVSEHHERESGQGYPKGLTKDEIHQFAKIIGLVDIYEALTHPRFYREKRFSYQEAIDEIKNLDKQSFFDRRILTVFLKELTL